MLAPVPRPSSGVLASALLGWAVLHPTLARAQDFATGSGDWNSVSELVAIARGDAEVVIVGTEDRLDVGTLRPNDSLLILHPREPLPAREVTGFLRAGGRVALADDYGQAGTLLAAFQIGRGEPTVERALQLRGNPALLVARPRAQHRLAQGVRALVTNHPTVVYHRALSPVFELSEGEAVVLAGAVESGRLVVISDPSVLIDNMLELRGNRAFAENLVAYLTEDRGGRLYLLGPDARLVGRWGEPGADRPLHDLRAWLEGVSSLEVPGMVLRIGAFALAAIAVTLVLGALPRRSPYRSDRMFARAPAQGGFVGRVRYFARSSSNLLPPLLVYKLELEAEILRRLSLSGQTLLRDVLAAMRARGIGDEDVNSMRALLLELDRLRDLSDRPPGPPRISARRFRALVATGDRLLARIGERSAEKVA
jgi:hypothetical protein